MTTTVTATNPAALGVDIRRLIDELGRKIDELLHLLQQQTVPRKAGQAKLPDGRLDEAGIDALYDDFKRNSLKNREIAAKHDISLSGVLKRKAMWRQGRR